jgi:uncharacterized protein DUF222
VQYVGDEIAAEPTWTPTYASNRLHTALQLTERLPNTLDALTRGDIDLFKATTIVDHTDVLADMEQVKKVEAAILPYAPTRPVKLIREKLNREIQQGGLLCGERRNGSPPCLRSRRNTSANP